MNETVLLGSGLLVILLIVRLKPHVIAWPQDTTVRLKPYPDTNAVTWRERMANLTDVYHNDRAAREVRQTAVGWKPDDRYTLDPGLSGLSRISGGPEYYRVIRKGKQR